MQEYNRESEMDDFFRRKLEDASFTPPEAVWDKIETKLPPAMPFYHRYKYFIAAGMFSLAFFISFQIHQQLIKPSSDLMSQTDEEMKLFNTTDGIINGIKPYLSSDARFDDFEKNAEKQAANIEVIPNEVLQFWTQYRTEAENHQLFSSLSKSYTQLALLHGQIHDPGPPKPKVVLPFKVVHELFSDNNLSNTKKKSRNLLLPNQFEEIDQDNNFNDLQSDVRPNDFKEPFKDDVLQMDVAVSISHSNQPKDLVQKEFTFNSDFRDCLETTTLSSKYMDSIAKMDDDEIGLQLSQNKLESKNDKFYTRKGFYIGAYGGVNNNWLTRATKRAYNNTDNMDYKLQWGPIYGISTGLDFSTRWGIVVELAYSSAEGQKFEQTAEGFTNTKEIKLDYMKLPVLVKYRTALLSPQSHKPIYFNVLGGFHLSTIRTKNTYINNQLSFFDQKYNVHQWGLQGGVDVDFYLSKHLFITTGFRSGFGANLLSFPRPYGKDHNDPLSFQHGLYAKIQFRTPMLKKNRN